MSVNDLSSLSRSIPVEKIRYDDRGLVPAIVQDYLDGTVLMMADESRVAAKNLGNRPNLVLESIARRILEQRRDFGTHSKCERAAL